MHRLVFFLILLLTFSAVDILQAQPGQRNPIPNVFLDCQRCDFNYIRSNIDFVNYVRDQDDADIYLRITDSRTGGGGREFTLNFRGLNHFEGIQDTLVYSSPDTDSDDERRIGLTRHIRIGLVPFVSKTVAIRHLDIFYEAPDDPDEDEDTIEDPWNNWVFDLNLRSNISGEQSELNLGFFSGFSAERITHNWKIRSRVRGEIRRRSIDLEDRTVDVNRDWGEFWSLVGYSISDHASIGLFARANFSRTSNIALNTYIAPVIEFNFFPYGEYQERRFLVQYQVTPAYRRYFETTVFLKDSETIVRQELSTRLRYDQPWGRIDVRLSGLNYFHDFSINRLEINPSFNVRIIRGLSVSLSGRYRIINDQLALPGEFDPDQGLVGGVQRATSYDYSVSFGFSYTFGSIYSNIVNPRF